MRLAVMFERFNHFAITNIDSLRKKVVVTGTKNKFSLHFICGAPCYSAYSHCGTQFIAVNSHLIAFAQIVPTLKENVCVVIY